MEKKKKDFEWILSYSNILHKTVGMFNLKTEFQEKPEEKSIFHIYVQLRVLNPSDDNIPKVPQ